MKQVLLTFILILVAGLVYAAPTAVIRGAVIRGAVIAPVVPPVDPCAGKNVGDVCSNGVLYAGTNFASLGSSWKYMTTPGNCSDYVNNYTGFTPTCPGTTDGPGQSWADNTGSPRAYGVNTGVTSTINGSGNTTTLATNYSDTNAARYCENMTYPAGGYTDWYLPAKDELNLVLYAMKVAGKGNFFLSGYWSSTEYDDSYAWLQNFNGGAQLTGFSKSYWAHVRCVRKYL